MSTTADALQVGDTVELVKDLPTRKALRAGRRGVGVCGG